MNLIFQRREAKALMEESLLPATESGDFPSILTFSVAPLCRGLIFY